MEPEGSLSHLQKPPTCPYREPDFEASEYDS
jgi:hypothetical protein